MKALALFLVALTSHAGPGPRTPWMFNGAPVTPVVGKCEGGNRPSVGCKTCQHCAYCGPRRQTGASAATCAVCAKAKKRE